MSLLATILAQAAKTPARNPLVTLGPLVLMVAIFYLLLIRPQQKRVRQQRELVQSLDVGDQVVTIGGMHGVIAEVDGDEVVLEISPGTRVRFVKQAVARKRVDEPAQGEAGEGS